MSNQEKQVYGGLSWRLCVFMFGLAMAQSGWDYNKPWLKDLGFGIEMWAAGHIAARPVLYKKRQLIHD